MQTIQFSFEPDASNEQQQSVLNEIRAWPEVRGAGHIKEDSGDPDIARIASVYLYDHANVQSIFERLKSLHNITNISIPPLRTSL